EVDGLSKMDHPFAYLVTMATGAEGISDDLWEALFEAVAGAFGRPLAAAVARGRIVVGGAVDGDDAPAPYTSRVHKPSPPNEPAPVLAPPAPDTIPAPLPNVLMEPVLPSEPTVTVEWSKEPPEGAPRRLEGPVPLAPAALSDELLTSVVTEAIPFI